MNYIRERARGGAGLILPGYCYIDDKGSKSCGNQLGVYKDNLIAGLNWIAEEIHAYGAKCFLQINHGGRQSTKESCGCQPVAPSRIPIDDQAPPDELSFEEIRGIIESFGKAAWRAKTAGFDGVEVHGAHGYLIGEFLSDFTNRRTDKYGGDLHARCRFLLEVIEKVRSYVGDDFPVGFRFSADEYLRLKGEAYLGKGITVDHAIQIARIVEDAGINYLHVTAGVNAETTDTAIQSMYMKRGFNVHLAEAVRKVVKIPVIAVGSINDPELADSIIGSSKADLVAMGRQMLADPYFPVKAQEDRLDDIRPCIRCNECLFRVRKGLGVGCTVNPELGRESQPYGQEPLVSKRVIIIGGGPAGMAAALAARLNGHQVTLAERNNSLGGNLALASIPEFKDELKVLLKYYTRQLEKNGVEIMLGLNMTIEKLKELSPDTVVVATGARFYPLEGFSVDNRSVYLATTLIENPELATGRKVAILGGGKIGCETALCLPKDVPEITVIEFLGDVLEESDYWESVVIKRMLDARQIRLILRSTVRGFDGKTLTIVDNTFKRTTLEIDALILAVGMKPEEKFLAEMARYFPDAPLIGDCVKPRNLFSAIHEGSAVGRRI